MLEAKPGRAATRPTIAQNAAKTACRCFDALLRKRDSLGDEDVVSSTITKITWQRAGQVTEPGRYMFRFGWLTVTADDLAIWRQYPDGRLHAGRTA